MRERSRRPDYERFKIETDDPDGALRRILGAELPIDEDESSVEDEGS